MMNRVLRHLLCLTISLSLVTAAQNSPARAQAYSPRITADTGSASGFYTSLLPGETTGLSSSKYNRVTGISRYVSPGMTNIFYTSETVNVTRQELVTVIEVSGGRNTENISQSGGYVSRLCRMLISSF